MIGTGHDSIAFWREGEDGGRECLLCDDEMPLREAVGENQDLFQLSPNLKASDDVLLLPAAWRM